MTLIDEFDLGILKMYLDSKDEVSGRKLSKVTARTGETDTHTHTRPNELAAFVGGNK